MKKLFLALSLALGLLVTQPAVAHEAPEADATGCIHIDAVTKYNSEGGWVSVTLTDAQAQAVLKALEAPEDIQNGGYKVIVAKFRASKDQVDDADHAADLELKFKDTVMVALSKDGCFRGALPASAEKVAQALKGEGV